ncbi:MAG: membrane protein insertase YidC [Metamycoplasmataceae bacterium]
MSKQIKRSDKYDFFKGALGDKNIKKTPKEKFKLGFKWVKIAFYMFLLSLSLTGCIQSIAIQSSSITGSGIEFYRNRNDISPFVKTYKIVDDLDRPLLDKYGNNIRDENGNLLYQQMLVEDIKQNYLVTNENETITSLRNQISTQIGKDNLYGNYDNHSSSMRIIKKDANDEFKLIGSTLDINSTSENGQLIRGTGTENNIVFLNSDILETLNESPTLTYNYANNLLEIPIFIQKLPDEKPVDKKELETWEFARSGGRFQAFRVGATEPVKINDKGQYLKIDGKTPLDPNKESDRLEINSFVYSFEFEKIMLEVDLRTAFASEKFSRDHLQSLVNVVMQFNQLNSIDNLPFNKNLDEEYNLLSVPERRLRSLNELESGKFIPNPPVTESTLLSSNSSFINNLEVSNEKYTNEIRMAILAYQQNVLALLGQSGYSIPRLNFTGDNPDPWPAPGIVPFKLAFGVDNKEAFKFIAGGSIISQKPIVSWSDAWGLGPFYGFIVFPISFLVNSLVVSLPAQLDGGVALLSIIISVILARMLTLLLTYKSVFAQTKQQELAPKKAKIDAKYAAYKGNKQMEQKKRQETAELYKKNNINMLTPILSTLVSMPIFLAMWRIIQGIPFIKSTSLWGINFSQTSWRELLEGEWQYLILIVLAVIVQAGSQFLPRYLNKKRMNERSNIAEKEAMKKANKTQNIIMGIFVFMAVIFEAGVQIYWIVGGIWTMLQTLSIHHIQKSKIFREKLIKYV